MRSMAVLRKWNIVAGLTLTLDYRDGLSGCLIILEQLAHESP